MVAKTPGNRTLREAAGEERYHEENPGTIFKQTDKSGRYVSGH